MLGVRLPRGIPPCEGPETDQAGDGSFREGRSYPYAPSTGVSAAIGGGVRGERWCWRRFSRKAIWSMFWGTTIGKGFQGGIKRHHFKRGLMTQGSKSHRALGSIGARTTPGRVYKGKKMPGRMGGTKRKIRKLKIVKIDKELNVVMIKGALPGKPGNLLRITPTKIVGVNIPKN
uniref:Large ribosomal subunit protein uL3c n=1 Tax=Cannabis sativa TaxID=3483 RepID=A0A803PK79_CANSA